ncbi:MAG TPA: hypothetical protein VHL31_13190 [Geminicoccus sp.]|jgi:hypothetical protein|uniref:hypothetical protein n=1 Tax=Geminicoccus sp. TaxID=2024832 RepID=UPI002E347467|nr:hypothetical protein [Geminicoccus sp.]HEX2527236.1 hypothetical protein [Geminicoccus sp.]
MPEPSAHDAFFVGYGKKVPRRLAMFLAAAGAATLGGFAATGLALGLTTDDPGDGDYAGQHRYAGIVQRRPYPLLRLPPDQEHPAPRTLMLSGSGKRGVQALAAGLDGQMVEANGTLLRRGPLAMLQLDGSAAMKPLQPSSPFSPAAPVPLGRWRLAGEICDGKCYSGAMRPGRGLSHKACANLCLTGGVPPVFVSTGTIEGTSFFLLADQDGGARAEAWRDLVALAVEIEGSVERFDDLLVVHAEAERVRVL